MSSIATLKDLRCPKCGSDDILPVGKKGAAGSEIAAALLGGAIANLAVSSSASKQTAVAAEPLAYRCRACGNKFTSLPLEAASSPPRARSTSHGRNPLSGRRWCRWYT